MSDRLVLTILGSGCSSGVPRLGGADGAGDWGACDPTNPKNRRLRCSVLVERHGPRGITRVLVDTSPDLREQLLAAKVATLDAVLLTHDHADQLHGLDDLRQVSHVIERRVPVFADPHCAHTVLERFGYCFQSPQGSPYPPIAELNVWPPSLPAFEIHGAGGPLPVQPFWQEHGRIRSLGFRFGDLAYSPDVSALPEDAFKVLSGVDTWIVDALRHKPHPTHAHVALALEWIARVQPRHAVLTNLHQDLDYEVLKANLPDGIEPAFDGMRLSLPL
ncbi:phosphoribosyl 1,2-cyclic phosphate phosphodiesterase [Rhizomicrobium palustre]|uniref:Phosphoribosyl 1,2-cyclic phosphate phosphodiesterase n=1 Tax=Rhizomicrobium palustre TaxID=189966 RepID=A0A846N3B2_9PROT|nr:MBL fold metallo-hydrolase [Rhizomicrobium palustre]NIK89965.1 phosphoribosyl 1,2-cyclic phosphate phosphodiesterase [Rhizomicrobium palustre]